MPPLKNTPQLARELAAKADELERTLLRISLEHAPAALASSLSIEDMVITDAILRRDLDIGIFTLDTGRMHGDTLDLVGDIKARYGYALKVYRPDPKTVAEYESTHGRDAFYDSVEMRKRCCHIRKVEPLERALEGLSAWITGMRRAQSVTRDTLKKQEYDAVHGLDKFNPLADWSEDEVWAYLRAYEVPYNRLYDQGYRSIGCAPCSRPTVAGEDMRAGRWWWEQPEAKECGLHLAPDGKLVRAKAATA
jgi:phosphoadenosine phosphosulfate reductase